MEFVPLEFIGPSLSGDPTNPTAQIPYKKILYMDFGAYIIIHMRDKGASGILTDIVQVVCGCFHP